MIAAGTPSSMTLLRWLAFLLSVSLVRTTAHAQDKVRELTFTLVRDTKGRPMLGPFESTPFRWPTLQKPRKQAYWIQQHFLISAEYPYAPMQAGKPEVIGISGERIPGRGRKRLAFTVLVNCWCDRNRLLVVHGATHMTLELPSDPAERKALLQRMACVDGKDPAPLVILFRHGTFTFTESIIEPGRKWHARDHAQAASR
jgi:hypothetical protein